MAIKNNNKKAIRQLISINPPEQSYGTIDHDGKWYEKLQIQGQWLLHFGGSIYREKNNNKWTIQFFQAPEYSAVDLIKWVKGNKFSLRALWPEIMEYNLFEQLPELEVPVYFLVGRHDYNTPFALVERYYYYLKAPRKELIWFDHSAHSPMYEEAEKFNGILLDIAEKKTNTNLISKCLRSRRKF